MAGCHVVDRPRPAARVSQVCKRRRVRESGSRHGPCRGPTGRTGPLVTQGESRMRTPALTSRLGAEALGTFWLVFGGCGSAIFSAKYLAPSVVAGQGVQLGIGFLGVALAFGLTVLTMAYAVGHVSGAHFNPAVTIGIAVAKRFPWKDVPAYVVSQVLGGLLAGLALWGIARGVSGFDATGNLAANGYGEHSPGGYTLVAVLCAEAILTAFFLYVILGATDDRAPDRLRPHRHRPGAHPHPPDLDPDQQHLGEPGPLHRGRLLQRQRRTGPAVGVLAGTDPRRRHRRRHLPPRHRGGPPRRGHHRRGRPRGPQAHDLTRASGVAGGSILMSRYWV